MEFLQDNQPVTAWILDVQGARLRVFTSGQRELKLPLSRVLPWTGPQCSANANRQEMLDLLRTHHGRRDRLAEAVDALEIWDLAQVSWTKRKSSGSPALFLTPPVRISWPPWAANCSRLRPISNSLHPNSRYIRVRWSNAARKNYARLRNGNGWSALAR